MDPAVPPNEPSGLSLSVNDPMDNTLSIRPSSQAAAFTDKRAEERRQSTARVWTGSLVIIAVLFVAKQVFIPIALAILVAFFLRPVVAILERTFLRRTGAIVISLAVAVSVIFIAGWMLVSQLSSISKEIAQYSGNLEKKLEFVKKRSGGTFSLIESTLQRLAESADETEAADMKVRVIPERRTLAERYEALAPTVEVVASTFLVIVLVFFLLQDREHLRDRLLRLAGRAHLTVTTQAIGETLHRISRYLFTLLLINTAFGVLIGLGLFFLGVPHAVLWGIMAGLLRFIPYVGAVLSAALPTFLALAVFPGWVIPIAVLAMFFMADQLLGGFIEPMVIGHRVGVSPIALLLATIFWGWLWGPVGLLLATPITVCLTVAGEFIPALRAFSILFGKETPLEDYLSFYNRLLSRSRSAATSIADSYAEENSMEATFTDLFIPTLSFANEELGRRRITSANDHFIKDVVRELIVRLGDRNAQVDATTRHIVGVSVAGERLSLGTLMLTQLLRSEGFTADYFTDLTDDELLSFLAEVHPEALFVSCSNPDHLEAGYVRLAKVAAAFPDLLLVAGGSAFSRDQKRTLASGASYIPTTIAESKLAIVNHQKQSKKKTALFSA